MSYEVDVICPTCVTRIKLTAKNETPAFMTTMGNMDLIAITCECGLTFYISEEHYDFRRKEREK